MGGMTGAHFVVRSEPMARCAANWSASDSLPMRSRSSASAAAMLALGGAPPKARFALSNTAANVFCGCSFSSALPEALSVSSGAASSACCSSILYPSEHQIRFSINCACAGPQARRKR